MTDDSFFRWVSCSLMVIQIPFCQPSTANFYQLTVICHPSSVI